MYFSWFWRLEVCDLSTSTVEWGFSSESQTSLCVLTWQNWLWNSLESLISALILFTLMTWSCPRPLLLNHHLWGLRLQPVIPEGHSDHSSMWCTSMARWQHPHGQLSVAFSYVAWSWPNPYSSPGNFPIRYSSPSSLSNVFILYVFLLPGGESKDTFGNFWMGLHHHQNCMMVRENLTEPSKTEKPQEPIRSRGKLRRRIHVWAQNCTEQQFWKEAKDE